VLRGPLFPACRLHCPGETLRAPSGSSPERNGLPRNKGGSAPASSLSRPARSSLRAATRRVAEPDYSDSFPEGFMVTRYQATMPPSLPRRPDNSSGGIFPRKRTRAFHGAPYSALVQPFRRGAASQGLPEPGRERYRRAVPGRGGILPWFSPFSSQNISGFPRLSMKSQHNTAS
jgi:hypothetical protein